MQALDPTLPLPLPRAAYSDRTAWVLACLSRLAYVRFEGEASPVDEVLSGFTAAGDAEGQRKLLLRFESEIRRQVAESRRRLEDELGRFGFELIETFNAGGTQAYLARRESDAMAVLAFRGTEKDFTDIKDDLNARFYRYGNARVHEGFWKAFERVAGPVDDAIARLPADDHIYLTGHSLGGALALMAARHLAADHVAACYTFGSPRVGALEFGDEIKVPVYRVVNSADAVPRLPPSLIPEIAAALGALLPSRLARWLLVRVLGSFRGYRHHGDMRYLSRSAPPGHEDLRLVLNPGVVDRVIWYLSAVSLRRSSMYADHAIDQYVTKLAARAIARLDADGYRRPEVAPRLEVAAPAPADLGSAEAPVLDLPPTLLERETPLDDLDEEQPN